MDEKKERVDLKLHQRYVQVLACIGVGFFSLISLIILISNLISAESFADISGGMFYGFCTLLIFACIWWGVIKINIAASYKWLNIGMIVDAALSFIMAILGMITLSQYSASYRNPLIDVRFVAGALFLIYVGWQLYLVIKAFKNNHFNKNLDFAIVFVWAVFALLIILSAFLVGTVLDVIGLIIGVVVFAIIVLNMIYHLKSYVLASPDYLLSEEAYNKILEKRKKEQAERAEYERINAARRLAYEERQRQLMGQAEKKVVTNEAQVSVFEEKLKNLKGELDSGKITEEEYKTKRKEIIDAF